MTDKLQHHEIIAEWLDDDQGRAIMLTQHDGSGCNEPSTILMDPWQLREICERFGQVAPDHQAARTITTLTRRLLVLADRIEHLAHHLTNHSDHMHADLDYEQTYATATADIATEFCVDLMDTAPPAPASYKPDVSAVKASTLATAGKPAPAAPQASLI